MQLVDRRRIAVAGANERFLSDEVVERDGRIIQLGIVAQIILDLLRLAGSPAALQFDFDQFGQSRRAIGRREPLDERPQIGKTRCHSAVS